MGAAGKRAAERPGLGWFVAANLVAVAPLVVAWLLDSFDKDAYYQAVQEDEFLEWATVWAFVAAAVVFAIAAVRQRRAGGKLPWFLAGVSLFCLLVAGEEISWGQRIFGYRPPVYFLAENFQQELNVHNVISTSMRKLGLKSVILGYGVALAVLGLVPAARRQLDRLAIVTPPWQLAPAFLITYATYEDYPFRFTGEVVELMLGLAFTGAALVALASFGGGVAGRGGRYGRLAVVVGVIAALGLASAAFSRRQRGAEPEILAAVTAETEALERDFRAMRRRNGGRWATRCGLHKRVYSFVEKYDVDYLYEGAFARLAERGMPEERAAFFLDPWNSPYWIRDECSRRRQRRVIFVYSFGPNRKRESTEWELRGDDIGAVLYDGER